MNNTIISRTAPRQIQLCTPKRVGMGGARTYFSNYRPFSDRSNSREVIDNTLFYNSARRFDVFNCFSSHMSTKPAILEESARRIAARMADKQAVVIKELGAGYGQSMAILMNMMRSGSPSTYRKMTAYASDGFLPVVERMRTSDKLQRFFNDGKLVASHEDLMGELPCAGKADYIRISYALMDLPEDMILKENGRFYRALVRGYIIGEEDFVNDQGEKVSPRVIAGMLASEDIQGIIDLGFDIRDVHPRTGFDVTYVPADRGRWKFGREVLSILEATTEGVSDTGYRMGLNAARTVGKILDVHLKQDPGSYIEIFDMWTKEVIEGMPFPNIGLNITSVNSPNFPFMRAHLKSQGYDVETGFEDWKDYIHLSEPYIYPYAFIKWLRQPEASSASVGRIIPSETAKKIIDFLKQSLHSTDIVLYREKDTHPMIRMLREGNFSEAEIEHFFISGMFPEPVKSKTDGYYGIYQVVTLTR